MRTRTREPVPASGEEILERIFVRAKKLAGRYGLFVLAAAVAVVVALFALTSYRNKARSEQARTWRELWELPGLYRSDLQPASQGVTEQIISRCESLLEAGWETDATPWVLLTMANAQRVGGLLEEALESFRRLEREHPDHYAVDLAAPNVPGVLEEMGRYGEAARAYEALARRDEGDWRYWLGAGRSWELAGKRQAAEEAYRAIADSSDAEDSEEYAKAALRLRELSAGNLLALPPAPPAGREGAEEEAPQEPEGPAERDRQPNEAASPAEKSQGSPERD